MSLKSSSQKIPTEHDEQSAFVQWFKLQFPHIKFFAIPNGIRSSIRQAVKAKREGMQSGVPDLYFPKWRLWIEFKRIKGGKISPEQKEWHDYLTDHCNDTVIVAYGCSDAVNKLMAFVDTLDQ